MVKAKTGRIKPRAIKRLGLVMALWEHGVGENNLDTRINVTFWLDKRPSQPVLGGDAVQHFIPLRGLGSLLGKLFHHCERSKWNELGRASLVAGHNGMVAIDHFAPTDQIHDNELKQPTAVVIHDILAKHLLKRFSKSTIVHFTTDELETVDGRFNREHLRRVGIEPNRIYTLSHYAKIVSGPVEHVRRSQMRA